jgi:hypothetical protein
MLIFNFISYFILSITSIKQYSFGKTIHDFVDCFGYLNKSIYIQ